jgi:hypothetical protein
VVLPGDGGRTSPGCGKKNVGLFSHSSLLKVPGPLVCSVRGTPPSDDPALLGGMSALLGEGLPGGNGGGGGTLKFGNSTSTGLSQVPDGLTAGPKLLAGVVLRDIRVGRADVTRVGDPRLLAVPRPTGGGGGGAKILLPSKVPANALGENFVSRLSALLLLACVFPPFSTFENEKLETHWLANFSAESMY